MGMGRKCQSTSDVINSPWFWQIPMHSRFELYFMGDAIYAEKCLTLKIHIFSKRKTERNECIEYPYSTYSFTPGTRFSLAA